MTTTRDLMCEAASFYPAPHSALRFDAPASGTRQSSMLETFKCNLNKAGIHWYELNSTEEVKPLIHQIHPQADTICSAVPEIKGNKELNHVINPYDLGKMDVTIIRAEFGVSQTGMVWIAESSIPIRTLKHITQHLVILIHPDSMVKNMSEAYEEVYYNESNYGSFLLGYSDICSSSPKDKGTSQPLSISVCFV
ncbi:hypothetical protein [Parabacteroides sp. PF5-6]|uniref:hypothetical protein n=1 Tax=Parabacteroides sp. PF5-6 TaxID=1742403 RepID=UPI00240764CB|nr:hypothetical protein [Parabacteroides sp. PF5-6]MDF9829740.1 L-lactate dehydrogenase complex protein LldG [Parabacteroides sp. PF5-6]